MTTDTISQTVLFPDLFDKPLLARFDQPHTSSDGGAVLLKAAEKCTGWWPGSCAVWSTGANPARCGGTRCPPARPADLRHRLRSSRRQRRRVSRRRPHPQAAARARPVASAPLASQPTISRFENCATRTATYRMGRELATRVIERHARRLDGRARRIIIDLDPTDDRTHGAQHLSFFNGYYDSCCYLPLLAFLTFDREQEQYLCAAVLRPGNVPATKGVAEREVLKETGLRSTARCCGHRRHRQANSVRVCSPASRRVVSLRPRSAGLTALTPAPRTLVQTGSC